ncbi:MAG: hypothetical protein RIB61_13685 [Roseicyclus sp.]
MTVDFALFLSPDGIALAHRQSAGHWALVAEARMDGGDLDAAMADLRRAGEARGGPDFPVLLVLPDDQVLYTSFMAPTDDAALTEARIIEGLDGVTPYAVSDLVFEWRAVETDRVKVAVVAKETLGEAQEFAAGFGFNGAGFAAMPPAERFPGMPVFGETSAAVGLSAEGMAFGADEWTDPAAQEPEPQTPAEPQATSADVPLPEAAAAEARQPAPAEVEAATPAGPEAMAASGTDAAEDPAALAEPSAPAAEDIAPEADLDATDAPVTADSAATPHDEPAGASVEAATEDTADADPDDALTPLADPTLDRTVTPIMDDGRDTDTGASMPDVEEVSDHDDDDAAQPSAPTADRGKVDNRGGKALKAEKGARPATPRAARITPGIPLADDSADRDAPPPQDDGTPALGFSARRGKASKPDADSGQIVGARRSRLGFGSGATTAEPVLHPDAAPSAQAEPNRTASRLAAQLTRVRDASKARGREEPAVSAPTAQIAPEATKPAPIAARDAASPQTPTEAADSRGGVAGLFRRSGQAAPAASGGTAAAGTASAEAAFTSGLLARKPADTAGPSFRTGLILTLILLLLLAALAIWSVLFLPDSPMARMFGGNTDQSAALSDDPLDAPQPPAAFTAPPAMGERDTGAADPAALTPPAQIEAPAPVDLAASPPETDVTQPVPQTPVLSEDPGPAEDAAAQVAAAPGTGPQAPVEILPDIDADLDLPPLPPLPEDMLPSIEETERIYAEDGIWPRTPLRPTVAPLSNTNDVYLASIDPTVSPLDAVALSDPQVDFGESFAAIASPPPFGRTFDLDASGLTEPTPEGVLTPEGAFVVAGAPPVAAVPRPREPVVAVVPDTPTINVEDAILGTFRPTARPDDLGELRERQILGGFSVTELAERRPPERPVSAQETAAQASLFPQTEDGDATTDAAAPEAVASASSDIGGTALAVASSRMPNLRPANIAALAAAAAATQSEPPAAVAADAVAPQPSIPSNTSVTLAATERNAIRLREVNLIGVTGTPSDRRALVRLPSGRFVRVGVGDRLDGGRVAAIGEGSLQYVRGGRNITLEIPG